MNNNISTLEKEDLYKLDSFFKIQFRGGYRYGTMGYFFWKIFLNPFGKGFVSLIKKESEIVATTSITPRSLMLNQKKISVAEIGDTYTDSKFQGRGYFSSLVNESCDIAESNGIKLVYGTPNNQSLPAYIKNTSFKKLPFLDIRSYSYILRVDHILSPKIGRFFSGLLNIIFSLFVYLHNIFLEYSISDNKESKIENVFELPSDWDQFWNDVSKQWDFIFCRDAESIQWRFFSTPEKYSLLIVRSAEKIVGYVVYKVIPDVSRSTLTIADFLFLEGFEFEFNKCLKLIRKTGISANISSIALWCDSKSVYSPILKKNGFICGSTFPVICNKVDVLEELIKPKRVHFTLSDSDNI